MRRHLIIYMALTVLMLLNSCRTDDIIVYMENEDIGKKTEKTEIIGMYLLNEGNMGSRELI